jgi:hypothetical protein
MPISHRYSGTKFLGPAFKKGLQEGRQGGVGEGEATLLRRQIAKRFWSPAT